MLADTGAVEGEWLVALAQDAGKGRQGRSWVSAEGNFSGSTMVRLQPDDPPPQTLSLAAGLALTEAIDAAIPAQPVTLKWPNDLMLLGKKVAGILLERSGDRIAVGFGVNLASGPALPDRQAASLGAAMTPQAFAPILAASFGRRLALWRSNESAALVEAWQERAHPPGTRLTVHVGKDDAIGGRFAGLEPDGALRLMRDDGTIQVIRAADVFLS